VENFTTENHTAVDVPKHTHTKKSDTKKTNKKLDKVKKNVFLTQEFSFDTTRLLFTTRIIAQNII